MYSKQIDTFIFSVLTLIVLIIPGGCKPDNKMSIDERTALVNTRDSLDAISRDTILVSIGNSSKKIKMAWSRNTTPFQKQAIEMLLQELIYVEGGTFMMGCTKEQDLCEEAEFPAHQVTLSSYYIAKHEVFQLLWLETMGYNPTVHKNNKYPISNVSWDECQDFIKKLNHITSLHFALPTEAQWEYAAKGGNKSKNTIFSGSDKIEKVAWYKDNARSLYHVVGTLAPNELGIHDMSGNVWEWCSDYYGPYTSNPLINPKGPATGINRVYRGGSWLDNMNYTRISNRNCGRADYKMNCIGLRLVLIP